MEEEPASAIRFRNASGLGQGVMAATVGRRVAPPGRPALAASTVSGLCAALMALSLSAAAGCAPPRVPQEPDGGAARRTLILRNGVSMTCPQGWSYRRLASPGRRLPSAVATRQPAPVAAIESVELTSAAGDTVVVRVLADAEALRTSRAWARDAWFWARKPSDEGSILYPFSRYGGFTVTPMWSADATLLARATPWPDRPPTSPGVVVAQFELRDLQPLEIIARLAADPLATPDSRSEVARARAVVETLHLRFPTSLRKPFDKPRPPVPPTPEIP